MQRIDRYILGLVMRPMMVVVGVALVLLLLDNLLRLFNLVLREGQPAWVVSVMLASLLPEYFGLAIPFGLLLGVALAFRKLSITNELASMFGAGLGYWQLLRAPFCLAVMCSIATVLLIGFAEPKSEYILQKLIFQVRSGQFGVEIRPLENIKLSKNVMLRVEGVDSDQQLLKSVFLSIRQADRSELVLTAPLGRLALGNDHQTILLHFENGVVVETKPGATTPDVMKFASYDFPLQLPGVPDFRARGDKDQELTLSELWTLAQNKENSRTARDIAAAKLHRKLALAVTVLFLPMLALAVGVPPPRSATVAGVILGMATYVIYLKTQDFVTGSFASASYLPWVLCAGYGLFILVLFRLVMAGLHPLTWVADLVASMRSSIQYRARTFGRSRALHLSDRNNVGAE